MPNDQNNKRYDLEERTFKFAQDCRIFVNNLPKTQANLSDGSQLIDSSGSVGANYIEATELTKIFGAILEKSKSV